MIGQKFIIFRPILPQIPAKMGQLQKYFLDHFLNCGFRGKEYSKFLCFGVPKISSFYDNIKFGLPKVIF
jgi:hypothetical protein